MDKDNKVNLLMVEDDLMLCEGWADIFEVFEYNAKFYHSASSLLADEEAIRSCNLLVSDFYLPDFNGLEVVQKVRKLRPDLPIILLTGSREPAIVDGVKKIDRTLLLFKPIDIDELSGAIDKMMLYN